MTEQELYKAHSLLEIEKHAGFAVILGLMKEIEAEQWMSTKNKDIEKITVKEIVRLKGMSEAFEELRDRIDQLKKRSKIAQQREPK